MSNPITLQPVGLKIRTVVTCLRGNLVLPFVIQERRELSAGQSMTVHGDIFTLVAMSQKSDCLASWSYALASGDALLEYHFDVLSASDDRKTLECYPIDEQAPAMSAETVVRRLFNEFVMSQPEPLTDGAADNTEQLSDADRNIDAEIAELNGPDEAIADAASSYEAAIQRLCTQFLDPNSQMTPEELKQQLVAAGVPDATADEAVAQLVPASTVRQIPGRVQGVEEAQPAGPEPAVTVPEVVDETDVRTKGTTPENEQPGMDDEAEEAEKVEKLVDEDENEVPMA